MKKEPLKTNIKDLESMDCIVNKEQLWFSKHERLAQQKDIVIDFTADRRLCVKPDTQCSYEKSICQA